MAACAAGSTAPLPSVVAAGAAFLARDAGFVVPPLVVPPLAVAFFVAAGFAAAVPFAVFVFVVVFAVFVVGSFFALVADVAAVGFFAVAVPAAAFAFVVVVFFSAADVDAAFGASAFFFAAVAAGALASPVRCLRVVVVPVATLSSSSHRPGRPVLSSLSPTARAHA